jgi:hypothetical protein
MADVEPACGAGAMDLFADLSGSSGSQAAQAEAAAAAQSTAVNAEGGVLSHSVVKCAFASVTTVWVRLCCSDPRHACAATTLI